MYIQCIEFYINQNGLIIFAIYLHVKIYKLPLKILRSVRRRWGNGPSLSLDLAVGLPGEGPDAEIGLSDGIGTVPQHLSGDWSQTQSWRTASQVAYQSRWSALPPRRWLCWGPTRGLARARGPVPPEPSQGGLGGAFR